jgi:alkylation response protein AidB-like acyl-CoA dehydrogenase
MDFELSDEQRSLADTARQLLSRRFDSDRARQALDHPPVTLPEGLWEELAALGWIGIAVAADKGGSGGDILTACVLAEEAGRALLPSALTSAMVAAMALEHAGDDPGVELLVGLCEGTRSVACAIEEPGGGWGPDQVHAGVEPAGDAWVLSGTKILVPDALGADHLLVAARTPDGRGLVVVPADADGVAVTPMRRIDGGDIAEIVLEQVRVEPGSLLGTDAAAEATLREVYDRWTVLVAADLLGVAQAALDLTVTYAGQRVQFGRPIGAFQAVSHRLADVLVDVEITRSLLYGACLALDEDRPDAAALVSAAKASANEAAVRSTEAALQLHGGIGFSWLLRRARAGAVTLGDTAHHLDRIYELRTHERV